MSIFHSRSSEKNNVALDEANDALESQEKILLSGWIIKEGFKRKNWKRRFTQLTHQHLSYYVDPPPSSPSSHSSSPSSTSSSSSTNRNLRGSIAISTIISVDSIGGYKGRDCVAITTPKRVYFFTPVDPTRDEWILAISNLLPEEHKVKPLVVTFIADLNPADGSTIAPDTASKVTTLSYVSPAEHSPSQDPTPRSNPPSPLPSSFHVLTPSPHPPASALTPSSSSTTPVPSTAPDYPPPSIPQHVPSPSPSLAIPPSITTPEAQILHLTQELERLRALHRGLSHLEVAACLMLLAEAHSLADHHQSAIGMHQQSLKMKKELRDAPYHEMALGLFYLGESYRRAVQYTFVDNEPDDVATSNQHHPNHNQLQNPNMNNNNNLNNNNNNNNSDEPLKINSSTITNPIKLLFEGSEYTCLNGPMDYAIAAYSESLTMFKEIYGINANEDYARAAHQLGRSHMYNARNTIEESDQPDEKRRHDETTARTYLEMALGLMAVMYREKPTVEMGQVMQSLGHCYVQSSTPGYQPKGIELLRKAYEIFLLLLGPDHPTTRKSELSIQVFLEQPASSSCYIL